MRTSISADTLPVIGFNPRIRDGCEGERIGYIAGEPVSIHASVMDANPVVAERSSSTLVSIHASVMDANPCLSYADA